MDESAVIKLFEERSEEAISALSSMYGTLLLSLAHSITGNREDAEECVNDAYLAVWNAIPPLKPDSLKSYTCRIVRNQALKRFERDHTAKRDGGSLYCYEDLEEILSTEQAVDDGIQAEELARYIRRFLEEQNDFKGKLFIRRYWYNESYAALSAETGLSESALRTQLNRIKKALRHYLKSEGLL